MLEAVGSIVFLVVYHFVGVIFFVLYVLYCSQYTPKHSTTDRLYITRGVRHGEVNTFWLLIHGNWLFEVLVKC